MTSSPVSSVGFGSGVMPGEGGSRTGNVQSGGFQEVWSSHTKKQTDSSLMQEKYSETVRNKPGESLRARDEHAARTEKWEPDRNVEERTDIPEEKLEEVMEVLGAAVNQLLRQVSEVLGKSPEELQEVLGEIGLKPTDLLDTDCFNQFFLKASGAEEAAALLTDEGLYEDFQELMGQLETAKAASAEKLGLKPQQLVEFAEAEPKPGEILEVLPEPEAEEMSGLQQKQETAEPVSENGGQTAESAVGLHQTESSASALQEVSTEHQGESAKEHEELPAEERQSGGLPVQSQKDMTAFEPKLQTEYATESVWDADTQNIMRQIMDYMRLNLRTDLSSVEMQLHPENLGTLQIHIASKGGAVTASFVTQNETVKAALESQMLQLQQQFEEQGVRVDAIEVTVQTHQFEQNLEQGRGSGREQEPTKRTRVRRLRLEDADDMAELPEEDALTAEMMITNGNTVDYTV